MMSSKYGVCHVKALEKESSKHPAASEKAKHILHSGTFERKGDVTHR